MTEKQLKSRLRLSHRWIGGAAALLILVTGASGILLQHPSWLGGSANAPGSVAADPLDEDRLLRGTHWGVEQSDDGGQTWRELPMLTPPTDVFRIVFAPDDPLLVVALGRDALVGSRDGGRVWGAISLGPAAEAPAPKYLDLAVGSLNRLHLLTDRGLLSSRDGGQTWTWTGSQPDPGSRDWRQWVHDLHTGHLLGSLGRRVVEGGALALLFLTLTGVVLFRRNGKVYRR